LQKGTGDTNVLSRAANTLGNHLVAPPPVCKPSVDHGSLKWRKREPIVAGGDQKALFGFIALVLYDLHELDVGTFLYSKQDGAA
ncbi:hypothetical protein, partial [Salmonella enterica]